MALLAKTGMRSTAHLKFPRGPPTTSFHFPILGLLQILCWKLLENHGFGWKVFFENRRESLHFLRKENRCFLLKCIFKIRAVSVAVMMALLAHRLPTGTSIPCGHQFLSQLLDFPFSSLPQLGKQWTMTQSFGTLHWYERSSQSSWLQIGWFSQYGHLLSESACGRSLPLPLLSINLPIQ